GAQAGEAQGVNSTAGTDGNAGAGSVPSVGSTGATAPTASGTLPGSEPTTAPSTSEGQPPLTSGETPGADDDPATQPDDGVGGSTEPASCTVTIDSSEISEAIATVGIVTFSTDAPSVSSARIEFGLEGSFEMTAPVDLDEPGYRTLLLGMKQTRVYTYRVVVDTGSGECTSDDQSIETEALPNILPELEVNNFAPDELQGGFVSTGQYQARGGNTSP